MVICSVTCLYPWELAEFQRSPGGEDGWWGGRSPDQSGQRVHVAWSGSMQSCPPPSQHWLEPQMIRSQPVTSSRYREAQVTTLSHMYKSIKRRKILSLWLSGLRTWLVSMRMWVVEFPLWLSGLRTWPVSTRMWVQSQALLIGLRIWHCRKLPMGTVWIWHCCGYSVGWQLHLHSSIPPLAWEFPYVPGAAPQKEKEII